MIYMNDLIKKYFLYRQAQLMYLCNDHYFDDLDLLHDLQMRLLELRDICRNIYGMEKENIMYNEAWDLCCKYDAASIDAYCKYLSVELCRGGKYEV